MNSIKIKVKIVITSLRKIKLRNGGNAKRMQREVEKYSVLTHIIYAYQPDVQQKFSAQWNKEEKYRIFIL